MTNEEKFKYAIDRIRKEKHHIGVSKYNGLPYSCCDIPCVDCLWKDKNCIVEEREWLKQEYNGADVTVCDCIRLDDAIDKHIIADSIAHYGADMQATVCMEECAELIQAISKELRGKHNTAHLAEEMADVLICIEMLKQIYHVSDSSIADWIKIKQDRIKRRMEGLK